MNEELFTDKELAEMKRSAQSILYNPTKNYNYRTDWKGGAKNIPEEDLASAALELGLALRQYENLRDATRLAQLAFYTKITDLLDEGLPVDFIVEHADFGYRTTLYRVIREKLPKLQAELDSVTNILKEDS